MLKVLCLRLLSADRILWDEELERVPLLPQVSMQSGPSAVRCHQSFPQKNSGPPADPSGLGIPDRLPRITLHPSRAADIAPGSSRTNPEAFPKNNDTPIPKSRHSIHIIKLTIKIHSDRCNRQIHHTYSLDFKISKIENCMLKLEIIPPAPWKEK